MQMNFKYINVLCMHKVNITTSTNQSEEICLKEQKEKKSFPINLISFLRNLLYLSGGI